MNTNGDAPLVLYKGANPKRNKLHTSPFSGDGLINGIDIYDLMSCGSYADTFSIETRLSSSVRKSLGLKDMTYIGHLDRAKKMYGDLLISTWVDYRRSMYLNEWVSDAGRRNARELLIGHIVQNDISI